MSETASSVHTVPTQQALQQQTQTAWSDWLLGRKTDKTANVYQAYAQRAFDAEQAAINRQFQERLSSSAYQRAMEDMKKAGLNPALLYGGAKPASTPSGATAHGTPVQQAGTGGAGIISSVLTLAGLIATKGMSLAATSAKASNAASVIAKAGPYTKATPEVLRSLDNLYNKMR
jgi:hypothetical protein